MTDRTPKNPPLILPVPKDVKRPLWSIMIPTYNCIQYLEEALKSVLTEDEGSEKMQIEVIDDYSTDGDVKALVNEIGKGRIGYFRQEKNIGSLRNFESCISRSVGQWIHILHGDDMIKPGFYKEIEFLFTTFPEAGAAFTNYSAINNQGALYPKINGLLPKPGIIKDFLYKICMRQLIQPPAIVVQRKVYEELGSFYAVHYGEDWEMWSRIASKFPIAYSPKDLATYRVFLPSSITNLSINTGQNIKDIMQVVTIMQEYFPSKIRKKIKRYAHEYYAIYCIKLANNMLSHNKNAALIQARGALMLSKSHNTFLLLIRFYLMYLLRLKKIKILYKVFIKSNT